MSNAAGRKRWLHAATYTKRLVGFFACFEDQL